jgi:hypothetical protein
MKRDPSTDAPNFFSFARDYLHTYMPTLRGLSPRTIEAYRISLECFLSYLVDHDNVEREHVSFDHFDRRHLKAWLTWMVDDRHYAPRTIALRLAQRRQGVPGLLVPRRHHPRRAQPGSEGPAVTGQPQSTHRLPHRARDTGRPCRLRRPDGEIAQEPDAAHPPLRQRRPRQRGHRPDPGRPLSRQARPCHPHREGSQDPRGATDRQDDRASARLPRRVPPGPGPTACDETAVLQSAPRPAHRTVSRHALGSAETSRPYRSHGLSHDP